MVLNSQNEKFAGFRLLAQIEARIDAVDRLKNKNDDLIMLTNKMGNLKIWKKIQDMT